MHCCVHCLYVCLLFAVHGSALSLVSSSSSVYSTADEKTNSEIRKLRRELENAQEKVHTLNSQLSTNAHVVSAFEQSLSNMTNRLQHLTSTAEAKDSELAELRATIESLKKQSGINVEAFSSDVGSSHMSRHMSTDSVSSINSVSSACSGASHQSAATDSEAKKAAKAKKKGWLRSSFSKAFSAPKGSTPKQPGTKKCKNGSMSDVEPDTASMRSDFSVPNSPLLMAPHAMSMPTTPVKSSHSSGAISGGSGGDDSVLDLQQQLHEKDMKLTDIRLEALSSASQLEQLRDTMNRMKNEMSSLKADNTRLQTLISSKGISPGSPTTTAPVEPLEKRLSLGDPSSLDLLLSDTPDREGRRVTLSVSLTTSADMSRSCEQKLESILIGAISVSGKTKWEMLDTIVRKVFKEYVMRVDPSSNMGLTGDSVQCYTVADQLRTKDSSPPELLPCGYLVADQTNISVVLKGTAQGVVDSLAFESLIPRPIMQRYVSLLMEHRRIILCGPSGTGKTYLAHKLAEYLMVRTGKDVTPGAIATFNVDHKSSKELRQYLANIADQCEHSAADLPDIIILDNLHHVASLGEVFNGLLSVKNQTCPYIIGTMNQATCSSTNLQLHHNFRWVLCANHMEPVKGFLGRYLRRKVIHQEIKAGARNPSLQKVIEWIPKIWQHLNKFLETHSSSDVTIGPRLFLSCPMETEGSQVWFTDLWNYSIVPYLLEAVREGIQLYGRRAPWEDPTDWVIETYPWIQQGDPVSDWPSLLRLRPEDVGYDAQGSSMSGGGPAGGGKACQGAQQSDAEGDPLLNMLMRLQEAASYSSPQSQDSDSTSLDSHSSGQLQEPSRDGVESTL
ncbi:hypothetical protein CAPTEDRAFT_180541 [Capitella teleta]|uniref:AAA+ ATPase domain-containing protein n=1 Tax=Capitella teleta TaxID=283909 RepID=R7V7W8_CAPTE|nr:hypothetical protein CAPTEDRAFT_180541 [Capitella teleta]|eukprot:ELU14587.1 hypothetical protein CAPTEDRAFT_180541 [Capitella teleta]